MIEVSHLTKRYPGRVAVNDVSFHVNAGEIVGFLGPNGAGKTTTMRVLSGYMPATGGEVKVAGYDVFTESMEVRSRIGYLPENCPLYPEMRVNEYLKFRARLKGVRASVVGKRVREVLDLCDLGDVRRAIIGNLSKGFRQRVGLAEVLIHEPDLLILDEPTIGLDPHQIRHVRTLIKDLARRHTVLLSTHILPEVEMICERVLIINNGKIVASDTPENLGARIGSGHAVILEAREEEDILRSLKEVEGVSGVEEEDGGSDWHRYRIACEAGADPRAAIHALAVRKAWTLRELHLEQQSLEDLFVELTGQNGGGAT